MSDTLIDLLNVLELHLVDYPTPENIHMQRKYLSDIRQHLASPEVVERVAEAIEMQLGEDDNDVINLSKAALQAMKGEV